MEKNLLHYVAPCSLLCYTCTAFKDGPVSDCAKRLYTYYDGYCELCSAGMSEEKREEWHLKFNAFHSTLQHIGDGASCPGCRNNPTSGSGCREGCVIPACVKERGVDFCAECDEFLCDKISWSQENGSRRIKEVGIGAYFDEKKDTSHYIHYKKKAE